MDATKLPGKELYARYSLTGTTKWKELSVLRYVPGLAWLGPLQVPATELTPGNTYDFERALRWVITLSGSQLTGSKISTGSSK